MVVRQSHLPAALASTRCDVAAIVDPVIERATQLARDYGIKTRIVARVEDVLDDIEGAVIATPNDSHKALALTCLNAGVATLIEKPLASTLSDGETIVEAGRANSTLVAVGYASRFRENVLLLRELLDGGHCGVVQRFVHQIGTQGGWTPMSSYNLSRTAVGGGVLVITGSHFLDRMLYFWGYPEEIEFTDDSLGGPEANCTATFRFKGPGGVIHGMARYSKTTSLPAGLVIETNRGILRVRDSDDADIEFFPHAAPTLHQIIRRRGTPPFGAQRSVFGHQLEDFVDAVRNNCAPMVDGRQGLESMRLLEALYARREVVNPDWYFRQIPRGR